MDPAIIAQMIAAAQDTRKLAADPTSGMTALDVMTQDQRLGGGVDQYLSSLKGVNALTRLTNLEALDAQDAIEKRRVAMELQKIGIGNKALSNEFELPIMGEELQQQAMRGLAQKDDIANTVAAIAGRRAASEAGSTDLEGQTLEQFTGVGRQTPIVMDPTARPDFLKGLVDADAVKAAAEITGDASLEVARQNTQRQSNQREEFTVDPKTGAMGKTTRGETNEDVSRVTSGVKSGQKQSVQTNTTRRVRGSQMVDALKEIFPHGYNVQQGPNGEIIYVDKLNPANKRIARPVQK